MNNDKPTLAMYLNLLYVTLFFAATVGCAKQSSVADRKTEIHFDFKHGKQSAWVQKYNPMATDKSSKFIAAPEDVEWVRKGDVRGPGHGGCVRFNLHMPETEGVWAQHAGGMIRLRETIPANTPFQLSFSAKHISGHKNLFVHRRWGGNPKPTVVELSSVWRRHTVELIFSEETKDISFSLVAKNRPRFQLSGPGEFLLDEVHIKYPIELSGLSE